MTNQAPRDQRAPTKLKRLMFERGLSNRRVAEMVELSEWTVSRHANGLIPPAEVRATYAEKLGKTEKELGW